MLLFLSCRAVANHYVLPIDVILAALPVNGSHMFTR